VTRRAVVYIFRRAAFAETGHVESAPEYPTYETGVVGWSERFNLLSSSAFRPAMNFAAIVSI
jgi:hypothetical protein